MGNTDSLTPAYGGPLACGVAHPFASPAPRYMLLRQKDFQIT